jgi:hypothetical protein
MVGYGIRTELTSAEDDYVSGVGFPSVYVQPSYPEEFRALYPVEETKGRYDQRRSARQLANDKSAKTYFSLSAVKEVARWITRMLEIFGLSASTTIDAIGWTELASADFAMHEQEEVAFPYIQLLSQYHFAWLAFFA